MFEVVVDSVVKSEASVLTLSEIIHSGLTLTGCIGSYDMFVYLPVRVVGIADRLDERRRKLGGLLGGDGGLNLEAVGEEHVAEIHVEPPAPDGQPLEVSGFHSGGQLEPEIMRT